MRLSPASPIVIIGAKGQMGARFAQRFREARNPVTEFDHPLDLAALPEAVRTAALVLLCVPITAVKDVTQAIAPYLTQDCILADICSVKVQPLREMLALTTTPVVGTHPLFGPGTLDAELRIAVTVGRDQEASDNLSDCLRSLGFSPFNTTADEHDQAMAYIQGLNFVTTVAYLCASPLENGIERFFTPSFGRRMEAATKMITQDAPLFSTMFEANPHSLEAVRIFRSYLNVAAGGDLELLSQKALWWWRKQHDAGGPAS
ncbi:prephenate dehydrogenase [Desulfomicrobium macestii]|uniref:Prephenate dehydrogenase n=2 Tax=Desulfomicrobium TaxID=898 RepID=A0A8G2C1Q4_DESNO|nr:MULTISPECIES: prephenate dehydrogenase/arogenate dehydrogenase family protein [Desulfomicrobium]MBE1425082.1 prephenate dehydrogenase [Desulfomicrobium macestii]SFL53719.1 prephenate dehydrogenase [Desulfomicrobium norvegicum]